MNIKDFKVGDEVITIITERDTDRFSPKNYFPYGLVEVVNVGSLRVCLSLLKIIITYIEYQELLRYITREASYKFKKLSLEQLRAIKEIIENQED